MIPRSFAVQMQRSVLRTWHLHADMHVACAVASARLVTRRACRSCVRPAVLPPLITMRFYQGGSSVLTISKAQKWPHCANFVPLQWTSASTIGNRATAAASDVHASLCCRDVLQGMMQKRGTSPLRLGRASIDVMLRLITRNAKIDDTVLHNWSPGSLALN